MDDKPRILGVDDSLTIRKALEIVLKPAGYALELAADGAEALAKAKALKPAVILLDFILPDMRGTEVCRALADDPETAAIPVVLISAKGAEIRQAYQDIGNVVSYIAKPFKPQAVTSVVTEVLAKAAAGELVKTAVPVHEAPAMPAITPATPPAFTPPVLAPPIAVPPPNLPPIEAMPPSNGSIPAARAEEFEEFEGEEAEAVHAPTGLSAAARHELLDVMFETLRSGLEGVYVEEVDTRTGAAADQASSYLDLIDRLSGELAESLQHARSGARYMLYGDGSIRSLDETLHDVFRRACRLLFRAVVAGAVENESPQPRLRILVACHRDSMMHEQLKSLRAAHPDWTVFTITEGFRQLPIMTRLYGPTHVIAEVTGTGALWDQLRVLQRMPEARAMTVLGLADPARARPDAGGLAERGITRVLHAAFDLEAELTEPQPAESVPAAARGAIADLQAAV
jgi:CheY-like chemotaxis protein